MGRFPRAPAMLGLGGRLITEANVPGALPAWQSTENTAHLRHRADDSNWLSSRANFRPADALEDPEKDIRDAIARNRARQAKSHDNAGQREEEISF